MSGTHTATHSGLHRHLKNINDIQTDGTQKGLMLGNTSADGSGDSYHLHVDSNGIAKTQVINAPTIVPHSELNSGTNDNPRDSIAVGLRGRQTITDETTETFLLCDSAGHLQIDVANQPNVKLEDLSSSLNAQNASGTSRSIAVGLKGTTNISDVPSGSTFLLCDAAGHLQVDVVSGGGGNIQNTTSSAKTHATGTLTSSDALEVSNQAVNGITILCESSTLGSNFTLNNVKISSSSSGTYYALDTLSYLQINNTGNAKIIHIKDVNAKHIKVEMTQSTGASVDVNYTIIV